MDAMNNKKTLAPELRFKGFKEGWEVKSMGDLGGFMGGGTPATSVEKYWIGDIPWISSSDLFEDDLQNINIHRYLNQEAITESATKLIPKNSVLLISRVGVGKLAINKTELCTSQDFSNFIPNECDSYFIGYFLLARKNLLINFAQGTSIKGFTTSDIKSLKVAIPIPPEQQKIASFLSAVDEKIQQLTRKTALLEQYKKGVMQQLFSGKLRFKDENGKAFPKWEEKLLGEIAERNSTKNRDNNVNFVLTNSASRGIVSQDDYFDREIANQNNLEGYYIVAVDDFVYNPRISVHAPVGPIKRNKLKEGVMSPLYSIFRFKEKNLEYFEYYFETKGWHTYLESVSNIGARHDRMNIANADFFKMPIPFPCLEERNKITDFLKGLSLKIGSTNNALTQTQTFKKGLLQQMFV